MDHRRMIRDDLAENGTSVGGGWFSAKDSHVHRISQRT
jgi:hypothetical protein